MLQKMLARYLMPQGAAKAAPAVAAASIPEEAIAPFVAKMLENPAQAELMQAAMKRQAFRELWEEVNRRFPQSMELPAAPLRQVGKVSLGPPPKSTRQWLNYQQLSPDDQEVFQLLQQMGFAPKPFLGKSGRAARTLGTYIRGSHPPTINFRANQPQLLATGMHEAMHGLRHHNLPVHKQIQSIIDRDALANIAEQSGWRTAKQFPEVQRVRQLQDMPQLTDETLNILGRQLPGRLENEVVSTMFHGPPPMQMIATNPQFDQAMRRLTTQQFNMPAFMDQMVPAVTSPMVKDPQQMAEMLFRFGLGEFIR
jgi:arsenate reductase-like glutaredoxin family protein